MVQTDGNLLSVLVFFVWIPVAIWGARRWSAAKTATLLLFIPMMFWPEGVSFDLPGIPPMTKSRLAVLWLLVGVLLFHRQRFAARPISTLTRSCVFVFLAGGVVTMLGNMEPLTIGSRYLPGHGPYDAVTTVMTHSLDWILPFALGAAMIRNTNDLRVLFKLLVGASMFYGLFQLVEVRLSPQLNNWVYGYFQHNFANTVRGSGFRPTVFMAHGLAVAMFTMAGLLAATAMTKTKQRIFGVKAAWAMAVLLTLAVLNKSMAALLYAVTGVGLILWTRPKTQFLAARFLAAFVLIYPMLKAAELVPVDSILSFVGEYADEERVSSLKTRFDNEAALLERASERPFFGWGRHSRRSIYDAYTGQEMAISDGDWIITLGQFGIVGFFAKYLLLVVPIFFASRRAGGLARMSDRRVLAAFTLIVGFCAFDLLPNGLFNYSPIFFSGALFGCTYGIASRPIEGRSKNRGWFSYLARIKELKMAAGP